MNYNEIDVESEVDAVVKAALRGEFRRATERESMAVRLAAFRQLTQEIIELNKTEPLPPEFDEILSRRVRLRRPG
jgi:hypothetical protein